MRSQSCRAEHVRVANQAGRPGSRQPLPSTSAPLANELSRNTTAHLVNAIIGPEEFDSGRHLESVQKAARRHGPVAIGSRRHSLKRQCRSWAMLRGAVCGGQRNFPPVPGCLPCPAQETIRCCLRKSFEMAWS